MPESSDFLRVVDVFDLDEALIAADEPHSVGRDIHRCEEACHGTILIFEAEIVLAIDAGVCLHAGGGELPDAVAEYHRGKVQDINRQIQQAAAGELRTLHTLHMGDRIPEVGRDRADVSDDSAFDRVVDDLPGRLIPGPDGFGQEEVLFLCQLDHLPRLRFTGCK